MTLIADIVACLIEGDGDEDLDLKELTPPLREVLRQSENFIVYRRGNQYWLQTTLKNVTPKACRLTQSDVRYLLGVSASEFDGACVMDYGVAAFQKG